MNTQDDPRFANLTFPCSGFIVKYRDECPPEIRAVRLHAYDLSSPDCSIKTVEFRRLNDDGFLGVRTRCSSEMIFVSVEEAKEHIRKEMEDAVQSLKEELERRVIEIADQMKVCKDWLRNNPKPNET